MLEDKLGQMAKYVKRKTAAIDHENRELRTKVQLLQLKVEKLESYQTVGRPYRADEMP